MVIIITASPNTDGLTAACGQAALEGVIVAGHEAEIIDISAMKLEPCRVCSDGWGTCRTQSQCVCRDCLAEIRGKIRSCDGMIMVTPVYFGQPSERMKFFMDRFRRCEAFNPSGSAAAGKRADLIAAAGGSGNGTATCLCEMEMWCRHVGAIPAERVCVTRFNRQEALNLIRNAGGQYASSIQNR